MRTDSGSAVKEDDDDNTRAVHVGQPAAGVVNFFLTRMGLAQHLGTCLPADDARLRLAPAAVIAVLVRNIVAGHRPVYALGEWAVRYEPTVLGLGPGEAELLNDDRVGRMLDRLFDGDRASLITTTVLGVLGEFAVATDQLHNDSTTVTVTVTTPTLTVEPAAGSRRRRSVKATTRSTGPI